MELGLTEELSRQRERARELTVRLVELLAEREKVVADIARLKAELGVPEFVPEVERELRAVALKRAVDLGIDQDLIRRVLTLILKSSVRAQENPSNSNRVTHMDLMRVAKRMERNGMEVVHMEVGEPTLGAPAAVARELSDAALRGYAFYGEAAGLPELRAAIAEDLMERFGVDVRPENVVVTQGGRLGVYLAMASILSVGEEVAVIDPSWPHYKQMADYLGCRSVIHKTSLEGAWVPDPAEMERLMSDATKLLVLNYPNNPTGVVIGEKLMREFVELAERAGAYLLSDEVYMDYSFGEHETALATNSERVVMLMSFSKSWGMTGYRIGYLVAPKEIADRATRIQGSLLTCVPEFVQVAALKALTDRETPKRYREHMRRGAEIICSHLDRMGARYVSPAGGMYVFPELPVEDATEFALKLLKDRGVAVAPGSVFGNYQRHVRLSISDSLEKVEKGMRAIGEELRAWQTVTDRGNPPVIG
ncbi:MAG: aminotransferase class I/II-fold pyridoxal phosphate-dependent enzyme [Thaumarchaeota archaeon]|nr:aminotransferase class I/II-fold pyridoxal phosphate-dependent enzyme [Candidatus Calditenuaceae archaeon]MDW8186767.1 aminotransferase class I/II-fold pyridoxal phosphate-dependent enzyme [Nitrososphaerota archaeon]